MRIAKKIVSLAMAVCITFSMASMISFAENRTKISTIRLRFESTIEAGESGGDVTVTTTSSSYFVDEISITNEPDDRWSNGDIPKLKIYLSADDDYYFSSTSKGAFTFTGDDATYVSASTEDSKSTLVLSVKLAKLKGSGDVEIDNLSWDGDDGVAIWDDFGDAERYQVRLYRGNSQVGSTETTKNTEYDFSNQITRTGTYTFEVRGYDGSSYGDWEESDDWYVDSDTLRDLGNGSSSSGSSSSGGPSSSSSGSSGGPGSSSPSSGAWLRDSVGWWYCNADKTYTVNNWQYINNYWYFFNETGYMKTGWILWKNIWYYCDTTSGAMWTNSYTPDGYYVDNNGAWVH